MSASNDPVSPALRKAAAVDMTQATPETRAIMEHGAPFLSRNHAQPPLKCVQMVATPAVTSKDYASRGLALEELSYDKQCGGRPLLLPVHCFLKFKSQQSPNVKPIVPVLVPDKYAMRLMLVVRSVAAEKANKPFVIDLSTEDGRTIVAGLHVHKAERVINLHPHVGPLYAALMRLFYGEAMPTCEFATVEALQELASLPVSILALNTDPTERASFASLSTLKSGHTPLEHEEFVVNPWVDVNKDRKTVMTAMRSLEATLDCQSDSFEKGVPIGDALYLAMFEKRRASKAAPPPSREEVEEREAAAAAKLEASLLAAPKKGKGKGKGKGGGGGSGLPTRFIATDAEKNADEADRESGDEEDDGEEEQADKDMINDRVDENGDPIRRRRRKEPVDKAALELLLRKGLVELESRTLEAGVRESVLDEGEDE